MTYHVEKLNDNELTFDKVQNFGQKVNRYHWSFNDVIIKTMFGLIYKIDRKGIQESVLECQSFQSNF